MSRLLASLFIFSFYLYLRCETKPVDDSNSTNDEASTTGEGLTVLNSRMIHCRSTKHIMIDGKCFLTDNSSSGENSDEY